MLDRRVVTAAAVVALWAASAAAAQNPPPGGRRSPRQTRPAAGPQDTSRAEGRTMPQREGLAMRGGAAQYLADNPQVLGLTPVQTQRIRKVAARTDSLNAPLRAQLQQLTRGQQVRDMPPAERRQAAPQIRNVMEQARANDRASLDSVSAILTPEQATRLATLREDFRERRETRREGMQPRIDSARARAGGRPPRP